MNSRVACRQPTSPPAPTWWRALTARRSDLVVTPPEETTSNITATTVSLTVDDVAASRDFLATHFGYRAAHAADGFVSLTRDDAAADVVLLRRGIEVLPEDQRDQRAAGLILAFTVTALAAEEERLRAEGANITMPLREEPWSERLLQVTDPNGVVVQLVEWSTGA